MSVSGASCVAALMSCHVAPRVKSVFDVFSQTRSRIYLVKYDLEYMNVPNQKTACRLGEMKNKGIGIH